jgi:hypothetical protein
MGGRGESVIIIAEADFKIKNGNVRRKAPSQRR